MKEIRELKTKIDLADEEVSEVVSQGETFETNTLIRLDYDEYPNPRPIGKVYPTHVLEWNFICQKNMNIEEYSKFLKDNGVSLEGCQVSFRKFRIPVGNLIYYRHIAYEKWWD